MNAFASYAERTLPKSVQQRIERAPSGLELKMEEKQRLSKAYRAWKRADRAAVLHQEPRLRDFLRYLRTITPLTMGELLEAIRTSWLAQASGPVRILALELVSRHCDRINRGMGFEPLDDPIPPETSLYFRCRDLLYAGGRA